MPTGRPPASRNSGLTRVDMIAALLERHRGRSLRELIAALDREFGWKSIEGNVTVLLYTNQKKFLRAPIDPLIAPSPDRLK